jgi:hypothetical protein
MIKKKKKKKKKKNERKRKNASEETGRRTNGILFPIILMKWLVVNKLG